MEESDVHVIPPDDEATTTPAAAAAGRTGGAGAGAAATAVRSALRIPPSILNHPKAVRAIQQLGADPASIDLGASQVTTRGSAAAVIEDDHEEQVHYVGVIGF